MTPMSVTEARAALPALLELLARSRTTRLADAPPVSADRAEQLVAAVAAARTAR